MEEKDLLQQVMSFLRTADTLTTTSLTQYTKGTRVTPTFLVDSDFRSLPLDQQRNVMQMGIGIYAAEYLKAVNLSVNVGNVQAVAILDQFSTKRHPLTEGGNRYGWNKAATIASGHPSGLSGSSIIGTGRNVVGAINNKGTDGIEWRVAGLEATTGNHRGITEVEIGSESNLAIGKTVEIPITDPNGNTTNILTNIRAYPTIMKTDEFVKVVSAHDKDNSYLNRIYRLASGELHFFEWLFCLDMLKERRKRFVTDKSGYHKGNTNAQLTGVVSTLLSGNPSSNLKSAVHIMTTNTFQQVQRASRKRIASSAAEREKYFDANKAILLLVVDPVNEAVSVYMESMDKVGVYTMDDIKSFSKQADAFDINTLMNAVEKRSPSMF